MAERTKRGTVFCIGVGPGDPELLTLKAVRMIRECGVIAAAGRRVEDSAAYQIAAKAVPQIRQKTVIPIDIPMTRDPEILAKAHREGAEKLERVLETGQNVGYLILGDPAVYGSFTYLHRILIKDGFEVEFCSGVTSFCAAAAVLGISLAEGEEELRIVPGAEQGIEIIFGRGSGKQPEKGCSTVIMKAGSRTGMLREELLKIPGEVYFAEKCGREGERVARSAEDIPEDSGYMSLVIVRQSGEKKAGHGGCTKY